MKRLRPFNICDCVNVSVLILHLLLLLLHCFEALSELNLILKHLDVLSLLHLLSLHVTNYTVSHILLTTKTAQLVDMCTHQFIVITKSAC